MQASDLSPARQFARQFGVKSVIYGGPGRGKTPIAAKTSPRPVLLASEPGMLTLKDCDVPTFPAFSAPRIDEFFDWFLLSHEAKAFDTLLWDSASQGAEAYLTAELSGTSKSGNEKHGMKAYGNMSRRMMEKLTKLYFMPEKHIVLIMKQQAFEVNDMIYYRPYFPGKELPVKVPHLYDLVMRLDKYMVPGFNDPQTAFCTAEQFDSMGRDRSGNLDAYEPPNMGKIITKCMK